MLRPGALGCRKRACSAFFALVSSEVISERAEVLSHNVRGAQAGNITCSRHNHVTWDHRQKYDFLHTSGTVFILQLQDFKFIVPR